MNKTAQPRYEGSDVVVDTNSIRCIYRASPQTGMAHPAERANSYLRALANDGYDVTFIQQREAFNDDIACRQYRGILIANGRQCGAIKREGEQYVFYWT